VPLNVDEGVYEGLQPITGFGQNPRHGSDLSSLWSLKIRVPSTQSRGIPHLKEDATVVLTFKRTLNREKMVICFMFLYTKNKRGREKKIVDEIKGREKKICAKKVSCLTLVLGTLHGISLAKEINEAHISI
jgi:hypothetical protein